MAAQTPQPQQVDQEPSVFSDPQVSKTLSEDPLFRFLGRNWRVLIALVGVAVLAYFFNHMFQSTYVETMQRSAEVFENVHAQYSEIEASQRQLTDLQREAARLAKDQTSDAKSREENQKKISELDAKLIASTSKLEALISALADTREPYNKLAQIYKALLLKGKGDFKVAAEVLQGFAWKTLPPQDKHRFFAEIAAFQLVGVLLDLPEQAAQGESLLKELALNSEYLGGATALRLAALASSAEQRAQAYTVLEQVIGAHPEHSDLLEPELARLRSGS